MYNARKGEMIMDKVYYENTELSDIQKIFCGIFRADNFPTHVHHEIEIISPINEHLCVVFEHGKVDLLPGDILIINSMESHSVKTYNDNCDHFVLQFDTLNIFKELNTIRQKKLFPAIITRQNPDIYNEIHKYINLIINLLKDPDSLYYNIRLRSYAGLLLTYICENFEWRDSFDPDSHNSSSQLHSYNKATEFILTNYTQKITLSDVADAANLSTYHFCRLFKQLSGKTFVEYITDLRLAHAENMLINGDNKIIDVAELSGFGSVKTFNQLFKDKHGVSPVQFRKKQNSENVKPTKKQRRSLRSLNKVKNQSL